MQVTPSSHVHIGVNSQVMRHKWPARGDQPSAQLGAVVLIRNEHKEEQPHEEVSEQRVMVSAKCAPPLLFASSSVCGTRHCSGAPIADEHTVLVRTYDARTQRSSLSPCASQWN